VDTYFLGPNNNLDSLPDYRLISIKNHLESTSNMAEIRDANTDIYREVYT